MSFIKRYCLILLALAVMLTSLPSVYVLASGDTPTVEHVYITSDSNAVAGATLTVNYTCKNGATDGDCTYQWWRCNVDEIRATGSDGAAQIEGADGKTYTLTSSEVGKYVFCIVTPQGGIANISLPYGKIVAQGADSAAVDAQSMRIWANDLNVGSTVYAHYTYQNPVGGSESNVQIQWQRADSFKGEYTDIKGETGKTYIIKPEDFGRFITFKVTANGTTAQMNNSIYCSPGNLIPYADITGSLSRYPVISGRVNAASDFIANNKGDMTWSGDTFNYVIDAGKSISWDNLIIVDSFDPKTAFTVTSIDVSDDNSSWNTVKSDSIVLTNEAVAEIDMGKIVTGRYIRINLQQEKYKSNTHLCEVQVRIGNKTVSDIFGTKLSGAICNNEDKAITKIPYGTTVKELKDSLITSPEAPVITVLDYDGNAVQDSDIVLGGYKLRSVSKNSRSTTSYDLSNDAAVPEIAVSEISVPTDARLGARVNMTLTGEYSLKALDSAIADDSKTEFKWYVSDKADGKYTLISDADEKSYKLTENELGKYVKLEVIPHNGARRRSEAIGPVGREVSDVPTAPTCEEVTIKTASTPVYTGDTLTGEYIYFDVNADEEDEAKTQKQWFRLDSDNNPVAILGETGSEYTTVAADENQKIVYGVKPCASVDPQPTEFIYSDPVEVYVRPIPNVLVETISIYSKAGAVRAGDTIEGKYTLKSENGAVIDDSKTQFKWYAASTADGEYTPISGANQKTYTVSDEYVFSYLRFEVIPFGGTSRKSEPVGPVQFMPEDEPDSPTVEHVYITSDSNAVVGAKLSVSAEYKGGASEDECTYKWYSSEKEEINATDIAKAVELGTDKTYTLTSAEKDKYIFCVVTPKGGRPNISLSYGKIVAQGAASASVDSTSMRIYAKDMRIGSTLYAHYTYRNPGGGADEGTKIQWQRADSFKGTYRDIEGETGTTYVLKPEDYGKFITFKATPDGGTEAEMSKRIYCTPGNVIAYADISCSGARNPVMSNRIQAATDFIMDNEGNMSWSSTEEQNIYTIDAGRRVTWDKLVFAASTEMDKITKLEVSEDGSTYTDLETEPFAFSEAPTVYLLDNPVSGRYIRISFSRKSNAVLKEIQAYLQPESSSELSGVDIDGTIYNPAKKVITKIPSGTTAAQLKAALKTPGNTNIQILDYSGNPIADNEEIASGYTIKVVAENGKTTSVYSLSNEAKLPDVIVREISVPINAKFGIRVNLPLTGSYTLESTTDSPADDSQTAYKWYYSTTADGDYSVIDGAVGKEYTPTENELGGYLRFEVIPYDGASRRSAAVGPVRKAVSDVPQAPECEPVTINTPSETVYAGDVLSGNYVYFDINGDAEDLSKTQKQWFRVGSNNQYTPISGAVSDTYTLTNEDAEYKIVYGVKPYAVTAPQVLNFVYSELVYVTKEPAQADYEALTIPGASSNITSNIVLSLKGSNGSDITWMSSQPQIIGTDGVVNRTTTANTVVLTATIKHPQRALTLTKVFTVTTAALTDIINPIIGGGGSGGSGGNRVTAPAVKTEPVVDSDNSQESSKPFGITDLSSDAWSYPYVIDLMEKGVLSEPEDGKFRPADSLKREECVKMLCELFGINDENAICEFTDVNDDAWFYRYVASAAARGLVNGIGDYIFGTGNNITRQDFAVMCYNFLCEFGLKKDLDDNTITFTDENEIADYAKEAVDYLVQIGAVNGTDEGAFLPNNDISRQEAAKILSCLLAK